MIKEYSKNRYDINAFIRNNVLKYCNLSYSVNVYDGC